MARTKQRTSRRQSDKITFSEDRIYDAPPPIKRPQQLEPKTPRQREYMNSIRHSQVTIGVGPAGTGKTYIAGSLACDMLQTGLVDKIIITRPAIDAGESLGFLPGELEEKYEPYIAAFRDVLNERLGKSAVDHLMKVGRIEGMPFAYMRGRTFKNCIVILDEAQNATPEQMKLFLTRIGENCRVVIDGDASQADIKNSGLLDAVARIRHIPSVKVVKFSREDVVRSGFVSEVIQAYEDKPVFPALDS